MAASSSTDELRADTSRVIDLKQLIKDLHEVAPQWRTFGVYLGVPIGRLDGLMGESSMVDRCFTDVIVMWLNEGGNVDDLVKALRSPGVDHGRLAADLEKNKHQVKLELPYLLEKLSGCKANWYFLGLFLGIKDSELESLQRDNRSPGVDKCFSGTLKFWLTLKETNVNLETLVKALQLCGYGRLAHQINSKYKGLPFIRE